MPLDFQNVKDPDFLNTLLEKYKAKAANKQLGRPYAAFIEECRQKGYPQGTPTEKHHIKPRHAGGLDEPSNLIDLRIPDHIFAHWLLWQEDGNENDKRAYTFRVASSAEREKLRLEFVKANVADYKAKGLFFYDPAFQSAQGTPKGPFREKGGRIGGSINSAAQFAARQKVGNTYGAQTGTANQSPLLKEFLEKYSIWDYKGCQDLQGTCSTQGKVVTAAQSSNACPAGSTEVNWVVLVSPKPTFKNLAETLNLFAPGSVNIRLVASMHKLVHKNTSRIYGWKIHNTLTRSEVEQGALKKLTIFDQLCFEDFIPD